MQNNFLVSIVLSTRNRAEYITKALQSVLNQSYKNIEVIVVNDGSTDKTSEIISAFAQKDNRIIILTNKVNLGFVKSLNKGIAFSHGKYIARIDDDDFWSDSKKLEEQVRFFESNPNYVLTGGGTICIDERGREISRYQLPEKDEDIRKRILFDNCFVHSTVVFEKKAFEKSGGYDKNFIGMEDWDLWMRMGKIGKFYNFPKYFTYYLKQSRNNLSNLNIRNNLRNQIRMRKKYKNFYPGYQKANLLGWVYYFSSFLPLREKMRLMLIKIRTLFFGRPPYKYFK
jgi:glycosyltransferase involved in cell wall biosynthesis